MFELLKQQMTEVAKAKGEGKAHKGLAASANFMRQFRDSDSLELKKLSAAQFMEVWEHYDNDGKTDFKIAASILRGREAAVAKFVQFSFSIGLFAPSRSSERRLIDH